MFLERRKDLGVVKKCKTEFFFKVLCKNVTRMTVLFFC